MEIFAFLQRLNNLTLKRHPFPFLWFIFIHTMPVTLIALEDTRNFNSQNKSPLSWVKFSLII